jgi:methylated-DNA-[protein]-cysteine S-methyltransferase
MKSHFKERVIAVVKAIPPGKTLSYGQVAAAAGAYGASRAVGTIMARNTDLSVPCHRVIKADGTEGEYNGLRGAKEEALRAEGVTIDAKGRVC